MTETANTQAPLAYSVDGAVATITLNRPKQFNAFNRELRLELLDAVKKAEADDKVRVVIVKGTGRGFCAGADLSEGVADPVSVQLDGEYKPFLTAIAEGSKIYIAQVHGVAAGIGAAVAMNCDLVTMAEDATLYMAFAAIGLIPDGGNTWLLLNYLGYHRAMEMILEGQHLLAKDCHAAGIVNKIAPADELDDMTKAWAEKLATGAPLAMQSAKEIMRSVGHKTYADAISLEAQLQDPLVKSEDFKDAVAAFFEKRKPVFKGR